MKFSIDKRDSYAILKFNEAKLNTLLAPEIKTELVILNNEGFRNVILDLEDVDFVDSSGLSAILIGNRLSTSSGGKLILTNLSGNVARLIKISQLDKVLVLIPTVQESRDFIMMEELEREMNDGSLDS